MEEKCVPAQCLRPWERPCSHPGPIQSALSQSSTVDTSHCPITPNVVARLCAADVPQHDHSPLSLSSWSALVPSSRLLACAHGTLHHPSSQLEPNRSPLEPSVVVRSKNGRAPMTTRRRFVPSQAQKTKTARCPLRHSSSPMTRLFVECMRKRSLIAAVHVERWQNACTNNSTAYYPFSDSCRVVSPSVKH